MKPRKHNKLCKTPEECTWLRERIIPVQQHHLYAPIPLWLLARSELTPGEKLVYARMAFYAGKRGVARASHSTIAREVGMSRRQVIEIITSLLNRHLIELDGTGQRGIGRYRFLSHPWMQEVEKCELTSQVAVDSAPGKCELTSQVPVNSVPERRELSSPKKRYEKKNQNTESYAREAPAMPAVSPPRRAPETRAKGRGEDSIRRQNAGSLATTAPSSVKFARDEESIRDEVWRDLCNAVGRREMANNGAMWEKRWKLTRRALALAVSDWKAKTPAEKQAGEGNAAAYITTAYEREKRREG